MEISTNRNKWIVEWANEIIYAEIPIWEKCILTCTLTIEEAAKYFRIGEKKSRSRIASSVQPMVRIWMPEDWRL